MNPQHIHKPIAYLMACETGTAWRSRTLFLLFVQEHLRAQIPCLCGEAKLAARLRCSDRWMRGQLRDLARRGWIRIVRRGGRETNAIFPGPKMARLFRGKQGG